MRGVGNGVWWRGVYQSGWEAMGGKGVPKTRSILELARRKHHIVKSRHVSGLMEGSKVKDNDCQFEPPWVKRMRLLVVGNW